MADGRQGLSDGMTVYEMAEVLQAQGCVKAIYLDGGGSATYASRHEGSNKLTIQEPPVRRPRARCRLDPDDRLDGAADRPL